MVVMLMVRKVLFGRQLFVHIKTGYGENRIFVSQRTLNESECFCVRVASLTYNLSVLVANRTTYFTSGDMLLS